MGNVLVWSHQAEIQQDRGARGDIEPLPRRLERCRNGIRVSVVAVRNDVRGPGAEGWKAFERHRSAVLGQADDGIDPRSEHLPEPRLDPGVQRVVAAEVVDRPKHLHAAGPGEDEETEKGECLHHARGGVPAVEHRVRGDGGAKDRPAEVARRGESSRSDRRRA